MVDCGVYWLRNPQCNSLASKLLVYVGLKCYGLRARVSELQT